MLSQAPVHPTGATMASGGGESPPSSDILTPDDSVSFVESDPESNMSVVGKKAAADKSAAGEAAGPYYQFDLAIGRELLMERTKDRSDIENESDEPIRSQSRTEVIPDCSGRYVENKA
jgi:hypothetical protein